MIRQSNSFIDGNSVIIDMAGADVQSFYADTSGVTIKNLTIKNGSVSISYGAAVWFNQQGTIENCNLRAGEYLVTAQYGDTIIENVVTVNNKLSIVDSGLVMSYRNGSAFEVQLVDENGSHCALANEPVKITVAGKTYTRYTDGRGVARIVTFRSWNMPSYY